MTETPKVQAGQEGSGDTSKQEKLRELNEQFLDAKRALEAGDRETAKEYLPAIYDGIMTLNKRSKDNWASVWIYNPEGSLAESEFDTLNHNRKVLSNDIGIMTASGVIRHDLNIL